MAWLTGWTYRKEITLSRASGAVTDYQMKLLVGESAGAAGEDVDCNSHVQTDFDDLRFTTSDGETLLDYWIESIAVTAEYAPYGSNPILSPEGTEDHIAFGSTLKDGETYYYYYMYHDAFDKFQIGRATSANGLSWTKDAINNPVFVKGAGGKFDETEVRVPMVWKEGSTWYMIYTGRNASSYEAIGYATSADGIDWSRQNDGNAVLSGTAGQWDADDAENWGIIKVGSTYYLWYAKITSERKIGLATSTDLIGWTKDANNPIFEGDRFSPFPFKRGSYYYLLVPHYTSGTDYSEFELYRDANPTFYSANRTLICSVKTCTGSGWDSVDEDTPCVLTDDIERDSYVASGDELWIYYSGFSSAWQIGLLIETDIDGALTGKHLAKCWIEFDSIGTGTTTFYMYYGKADATAVSSHINTMIKADDGVTGSFTEATSGTGTLSHGSGKYTITEDSVDDAAIAGCILADWNFEARIDSFEAFETTGVNNFVNFFLFDSASVAGLIGTNANSWPLRRFGLYRYHSLGTYPNRFVITYVNTAGTAYFWTGSAWTTTTTRLILSSGTVMVKIWSDGTNFYLDILDTAGVSLLANVASVAISSVKNFSNGKLLVWGEYITDYYWVVHSIDIYYLRQYLSPEPAWGSWGSEEAAAEDGRTGIGGVQSPVAIKRMPEPVHQI